MSNLARAICAAAILSVGCSVASATWMTHDWTVRINGETYGLQEMFDLPVQRTTLLFYGGDTYHIIRAPIRLVASVFIAIVSLPPAVAVYAYVRRRRHRKSS